jgi:hypothetical protein
MPGIMEPWVHPQPHKKNNQTKQLARMKNCHLQGENFGKKGQWVELGTQPMERHDECVTVGDTTQAAEHT